MGDEKYKEMIKIEKAKQNGNVDEQGNIIKKIKLTSEEKNRLRMQQRRQVLKEQIGNKAYKQQYVQQIAKSRALKKTQINNLVICDN